MRVESSRAVSTRERQGNYSKAATAEELQKVWFTVNDTKDRNGEKSIAK
jgi:hypothetical protein